MNCAPRGSQETGYNMEKGGFATTGTANDSECLPGLYLGRNPLEGKRFTCTESMNEIVNFYIRAVCRHLGYHPLSVVTV